MNLAAIGNQQAQERIFGRGQPDLAPVLGHGVSGQIHLDLPETDHGGLLA